MAHFVKDPDSKEVFGYDWAPRLNGEKITSSFWTVPEGITRSEVPPPSYTDTTTSIWLEGGTAGEVYRLTNRTTTDGGTRMDATMRVWVKEA